MTLLHAFLSTHKITSCLVAFSGGADSLCLLLELLKCQKTRSLRIEVAHLDHGWRSESAQEAADIRSWVESLQLPFHQKRLSSPFQKGNLEEIGRRERYQFFSQVCRESCALKVLKKQRSEMNALAKSSQQLNTESCVVNGNKHCEA